MAFHRRIANRSSAWMSKAAGGATSLDDVLALSNIIEVFDFSQSGVCFQERSSPTTASGAGDVVGTIIGLKNSTSWIAPSDAGRPVRRTSGGKWYLEFAGSDDRLVNTTITHTGAELYAGVAFTPTSSVAYERLLSFGAPGTNDYDSWARCAVVIRDNSNATWGGFRTTNYGNTIHTNSTLAKLESCFTATGHYLKINAASDTTSSYTAGSNFNISESVLGAPAGGGSEHFVGYCNGFVALSAAPSGGDRTTVQTWLTDIGGS